MPDSLAVMLVESGLSAVNGAAATLEAAGHRVHRCFQPGDRGFPCVGVTDPAACPIVHGVDVVLLVRRRVNPRPSLLEGGVGCAIRAGVPIVEDGPAILDPFEPWVTVRADGDVAEACVEAVGKGFEALRHDIVGRTARLIDAAGLDPVSVECTVAMDFPRLHIRLSGPRVGKRLEQALAVRVLDAVRASGRTYGEVDVSYETLERAGY
jgi:hypothetical protein